MELNSILATANSGSSSVNSAQKLAGDFDNFLTLLTTQLQHQDPLSPMDSTQFTEQLVQFASVEQEIATNTNLEAMLSLLNIASVTGAVGFIGQTVLAEGATAALANGQAQWGYTLASPASSVSISISNAEGQVVFTAEGSTLQGENTFVWQGLDNQGIPQPDGFYTVSVVAEDANGLPLAAPTAITGVVTGIENVAGDIVLTVNGSQVPLASVISVHQTVAPPASEPPPEENPAI